MRVDVKKDGDVVIAELEGRLVAGTGDELVRNVIDELVGEGWKKIVLNLSGVKRLDSSGVAELVAGVQLAERFGSEIRFVKPQGTALKVLEITQILPALDVYDDEDAAAAAFA